MPVKITPVRVNPVLQHADECRISLGKNWRFRLDPDDVGVAEDWFNSSENIADPIIVPGTWQGQGFGHDGLEHIWDFDHEVRVLQATYTGTGWYAKEFEAPAAWKGKRIWLNFGGVHPSAEVWLNGVRMGENDLPFIPFGFDVTDAVKWGENNTVVVRVHEHNRIFGHVFNWECNWSGLYRDVELTATGNTYIETCIIKPDVDSKSMRFEVSIGGEVKAGQKLQVSVRPISSDAKPITREVKVKENKMRFKLDVPSPNPWCPETPNLYRVDITFRQGEETLDGWSERTGFVKLKAEGKKLCINNKPYFWLGSGDHLTCPETQCPDADRERWRKKLRNLRNYGYHYVRCAAMIYTPEYYDVADEVGLIIQGEPGGIGPWGGRTTAHVYSWPKPTPDNYSTMKRHWNLAVLRDVNHPSANMYCMSNEFGVGTGFNFPRIAWELYHSTKAMKPQALIIWTDGDYDEEMPADFVNDEAALEKKLDKPLIQHEFRWWSSFPDVRNMPKYTGATRPYAAEMAVKAAERWGLTHLLPEAADVSHRLQFLEMKVKLEMMRRDYPELAGINHFNGADLNASPQGILNHWFEHKYASADLWLQTNNDTVVLCGLNYDDRVRTAGDIFRTTLHVSDYSHPPLNKPTLDWRLVAGNEEIASGRIKYKHKAYSTMQAGEIKVKLPALTKPTALRLEARLTEGDRVFKNDWNLWVLPKKTSLPKGMAIYGKPKYSLLKDWKGIPRVSASNFNGKERPKAVLTERIDTALLEYMKAGGRVILFATEGIMRPHPMLFPDLPYYVGVKYFFGPPANYGTYEDGQNGFIVRENPMLGGLPHEGFADMQFFNVIEEAAPIDLGSLDLYKLEPVIRVIHRFPVFQPLGYLIEGSHGKGGLIISALDLNPKVPEGSFLFKKISEYAVGEDFNPRQDLPDTAIEKLLEYTAIL